MGRHDKFRRSQDRSEHSGARVPRNRSEPASKCRFSPRESPAGGPRAHRLAQQARLLGMPLEALVMPVVALAALVAAPTMPAFFWVRRPVLSAFFVLPSACASGYRHNTLCRCVIISEVVDAENVTDSEIEWCQDLVEQVSRNVTIAVARLPKPPESVDHRVMRPEDRIEGRCPDHAHIT